MYPLCMVPIFSQRGVGHVHGVLQAKIRTKKIWCI